MPAMHGPRQLRPLSQSYVNEYSGYRLKDIAIIFIALETVFVALRFWSRRLQKASIGWDDILIAPAYGKDEEPMEN